MKSKIKIPGNLKPRRITDVDAIRIDWETAIKEAEKLTTAFSDFNDTLRAYKLLTDIQTMYRVDDIDGYLELITENGYILKEGATHFKEESINA